MAVQLPSRKKHQRRTCECLGLTCTRPRTIFCLPQAIRLRIYYEAGLITESDINLNGQPAGHTWPSAVECASTFSLLLSCHTIYAEASSVIYSTNRFFIRYRDSRSLQPLRNLTPHSLSLLTHLTVHLNVSSCEKGDPCCKAVPARPKTCDNHDKPLRLSPSSRHRVLSEWRSAVESIKAYLKPGRLHLHLVCDVVDIAMARQAALPVLRIPPLASCAIRLSREPDLLLWQLAHTTATRAMGHPASQLKSPFRFLDLPGELRRQIFEFTDLVTPLCEIEWSPSEGFRLRYSTWRCGGVGKCEPSLHYACQFRNCWEGSYDGCFCRHFHAAFKPNCHCWSLPTSLFLVCRALLQDARAVFFMRNRFVINHTPDFVEPARPRLEASVFLTDIVPRSAIPFLRDLELVFPLVENEWLRYLGSPYQDWISALDLVKEELCTPLLTVRFYMTDYIPEGPGVLPSADKIHISHMVFRPVLVFFVPLRDLKGLKAFFAYGGERFLWPPSRRGAAELEAIMELLVMGSDYDSMTMGKEQQRKSQWLEAALASTEYRLYEKIAFN